MRNPDFPEFVQKKKYLKFVKIDNNLLKCRDWNSAKEYTSCKSRKMQQKEFLNAKIGVDTAENEPDVEAWSNGITCTSYF